MNHYVKTLFLVTLFLSGLFLNITRAQQAVEWQSGATDRVYSTPAIVGDKISSGSIDGFLHCADIESGRKYYQYQTNGIINSELLVYKNYVILVSGNDLICFDPESMSEKWRFLTESNPELAQMHELDYHHLC